MKLTSRADALRSRLLQLAPLLQAAAFFKLLSAKDLRSLCAVSQNWASAALSGMSSACGGISAAAWPATHEYLFQVLLIVAS